MSNKKFLGIMAIFGTVVIITVGVVSFYLAKTAGYSAGKEQASSIVAKAKSEAKLIASTGKSMEITSPGTYIIGQDIKPGFYTIKLTSLEYGADDEKHEAYVIFETAGLVVYEQFTKVNQSYRTELTKGQKVVIEDNYSPTSWKLNLDAK
ncbi:hypothetical protein WDV13_09545 [Weissella cibaria]|uniref:hypothetical protein n=1 Tax=Weissella cibaria TaxID=137591 RepID=UPI00211DD356|nr:hypothetical protein [Weissella cibaria]MCQ9620648.1 hypothetical protein [Weissella cibaria]